MTIDNETLMEAFLPRASPETVFERLEIWYEAQLKEMRHVRDFDLGRMSEISNGIEYQLLNRNNEIIDLGLAAWGTQGNTLTTLYERWCSRSVNPEWPPTPATFPYTVLSAILANVNAGKIAPIPDDSLAVIFQKDLIWLIEHGENYDLLYLIHSNMGLARRLLELCSRKSGYYRDLDHDRWIYCLSCLGENKLLQVPPNVQGADLEHGELHRTLLLAAMHSPKTCQMSDVLGRIFERIPNAYRAEHRYEVDAAISAWNVEIADDDDETAGGHQYCDALAPAERIRFHLLRLYGSLSDPNDTNRASRLAAYARLPIGQNYDLLGRSYGLPIADFKKYVARDGPACSFAMSYNPAVWCNKDLSENLRNGDFPLPQVSGLIRINGKACLCIAKSEKTSGDDDWPEWSKPQVSESKQALDAIEHLRSESADHHQFLQTKLKKLQRLVFWEGLLLLIFILSLMN